MTDWGASNRVDLFEFVLCDPFTLAELEHVEVDASKSSLSWDMESNNLYGGTIAALTPISRDRLVRVRHTVKVGAETATKTLATMFIDDVSSDALFGRESRTVTCYSTLFRFTQDKLPSDFSRAKGANVVSAIRQLVEEVGGKLFVSDPDMAFSNRTFGRPIWFEMGENRMDVVQTIASWIDCKVSCDGNGLVTLAQTVNHGNKPVAYTFKAGRNCTYLPGVSEENNGASLVNRVVAYCTDESGTRRVDVKLGKDSPFSFERCGRYQPAILRLAEPCNEETLGRKANEYLAENSVERRFYIIEHVSIPGLREGDVVDYENDIDFAKPVKARCVVVQIDMGSLTPGAKCTTKLKTI